MNPAIKGLRNIGNTCYFNATLQALLSLHKLNSSLMMYIKKNPTVICDASDIFVEYLHLYVELLDKQNKDTVLDPSTLFREFTKINTLFVKYNQEDAHDALITLLNNLLESKDKTVHKIFVDTLQGKRTYLIKCKTCGKTETNQDIFIDLSVPIPHIESKKTTIMDCINSFYTQELLQDGNEWFCPVCKKHNQATITTTQICTSAILIVTLKRFTNNCNFISKNDTNVEIFNTLKIDNKLYRLIATINHMGSPTGGHYVAHVTRGNKWYSANDTGISEAALETISQPSVYVAVYQAL